MDLKRKAQWKSDYYYDTEEQQLGDDNEEEEEEEDEWEREASSSTSQKHNKQMPPNPYVIHADILTDQYAALSQLQESMEVQLENLQTQLEDAEKEEDLQKKLAEDKQHHYSWALEATFQIIDELLSATTAAASSTSEITTDDFDYERYYELDAALSAQIEHVLAHWKQIPSNTALNPAASERDETYSTINHFLLKAEFDLLDLSAQNSGLEAKIQSLTRDYNKLNGLPQIIPILKSEMESYLENMRATSMKLQVLETDTIRPTLKKLVDLRIEAPIKRGYYERKLRLMYDLLSTLDRLYRISLKQRSIQQIVSYLNERAQSKATNTQRHIYYLLNELDKETGTVASLEEAERLPQPMSIIKGDEAAAQLLLDKIEVLLADMLQEDGCNSRSSLSILEKFHSLNEYREQLEKQWEDKLQLGLDISTELDGMAVRIKETLQLFDDDSVSSTVPSGQNNLYSEFESKTKRLNATVTDLEQKTFYTDEKFNDERILFAKFFTDPIAFESIHREIVQRTH